MLCIELVIVSSRYVHNFTCSCGKYSDYMSHFTLFTVVFTVLVILMLLSIKLTCLIVTLKLIKFTTIIEQLKHTVVSNL